MAAAAGTHHRTSAYLPFVTMALVIVIVSPAGTGWRPRLRRLCASSVKYRKKSYRLNWRQAVSAMCLSSSLFLVFVCKVCMQSRNHHNPPHTWGATSKTCCVHAGCPSALAADATPATLQLLCFTIGFLIDPSTSDSQCASCPHGVVVTSKAACSLLHISLGMLTASSP